MLLHWILYKIGFNKARTQTSHEEREVLKRYATGRTSIVELGVFEGVTSRIMRQAMASSGTLWLIDPFYPGRFGIPYGFSITKSELNLEKNGSVQFIRQFSYEAVKHWKEPIDMIFIDADHSYQAVRQDWDDWSSFVVEKGIIAFHDSRFVPGKNKPDLGPIQLVKEIVQRNENYKIIEEVDTLTVFTKNSFPLDSEH